MSMLELRKVSKVYGEGAGQVQALADVDLWVDAGSLVAVMGASGSGKSTLLTIAGSLEAPTSGEVVVGGAVLSKMTRNDQARMRRRSIGYVFQDYNLLAGLTAVENVSLPLELDGVSARKARAAGMAVLEELGLADRAAHFPDELSGGERQRVSIARAVVGDRHLLLADEPSGALDSTNGEAVMRMILGACKRGWPPSSSPTTRSWPRGPTGWSFSGTDGSSTRPCRRRAPSRCSSLHRIVMTTTLERPGRAGGRPANGGAPGTTGRGPVGLAPVPA